MIKHTPGSLKKLGNDQEALDYLNRICAERGGVSCVKEVVFYPKEKEEPYLIVETDGFLYKLSTRNFMAKKDNKYMISSCLTPLDLINHKVNKAHNGKISYCDERAHDVGTKDLVEFDCPVHGKFKSRLGSVLEGRGCAKCGQELTGLLNRKDDDYFLSKLRESHGDKFNYLGLRRGKKGAIVTVECKIHGIYEQSVYDHILGSGCPKCSYQKHSDDNIGWGLTDWIRASNRTRHFDSFKLYVVECFDENNGEHFYKVGRTFYTVKKRLYSKNNLPYKYNIVSVIGSTRPEYIFNLENKIKRDLKDYKYRTKKEFFGHRECFSIKPVIDEYINEF